MRLIFGLLALCALGATANAQSLDEGAIQECACEGMELEVSTGVRTRIDCLSDTHAIEVEALQDWAEAIGQSLHYAGRSGKQAKVLFFCEQSAENCNRHWFTFHETVRSFQLPIEAEMVSATCAAQGEARYR